MGWAGVGGEEVHRTGYNQLIEDQLVREGAARRHV
jgi:hypothetical protein